MSEPLVVIDSSEVREGKLEELKAAIDGLVEFVETNEPRPIAYHVYLDEEGKRMTVVQVHPDSASMQFHMEIAGPAFPKFADLIQLRTMDVFGKPSEELMEQLRRKIQMLGSATMVVHELQAGFTRLGIVR